MSDPIDDLILALAALLALDEEDEDEEFEC